MRWTSDYFTEAVTIAVIGSLTTGMVYRENGVIVLFLIEKESGSSFIGNITSHLYSTDPGSLNGSNFTCEALDKQAYVFSFVSNIVGKMLIVQILCG